MQQPHTSELGRRGSFRRPLHQTSEVSLLVSLYGMTISDKYQQSVVVCRIRERNWVRQVEKVACHVAFECSQTVCSILDQRYTKAFLVQYSWPDRRPPDSDLTASGDHHLHLLRWYLTIIFPWASRIGT
jgi:hypothetical protein